MQHAHDGIRSL